MDLSLPMKVIRERVERHVDLFAVCKRRVVLAAAGSTRFICHFQSLDGGFPDRSGKGGSWKYLAIFIFFQNS